MDHKDITIFLELVRCRNISKTAENLYLSQSAVSSRLKALEAEMGCQLVLRFKGQRSVELTRQGEEFISVAERWKLLLEETEAVKEKALSVVRIATNGSTYDRLLDEFLRQYTERHPEKKIQIAGSSFPQERKKETAHVRNYQELTERHIFHVKRQ